MDNMKIMKIIPFLILAEKSSQSDDFKVAKSVADWFRVTCIVFYQSDDVSSKEFEETFQKLKIMSEDMKTAIARKFQLETTIYRYNSQRCSRMMHVVDGRREKVRLRLEQVSHSVNLGGPIWLLFLPETDTAEDYLRNTYVPFDSIFIAVETRDAIILRQVYRVSMDRDIRTSPFGNWTSITGLTISSEYAPYWRRNDLEGKSFKVSAIERWPLATLADDKVGGYFGRVWEELQVRLNFSTVYVRPTDRATGVWNNGKWNGLIGMISRGEIDAAISDVTMTPERIPEVDFLKPLYSNRYQLFFKSTGFVIQWDLIFRPFQTEVWLTLFLWLILLSFLLKFGYRIGLKYKVDDWTRRREYENYQSFFFMVFSAFSQQANPTLPKSCFCRLILATSYVFSMVVFIIYSCILMSMIAVQKPSRPFNSLESFLEDGSYSLHQIPGTDAFAYFSNSTDPVLQKIYQRQFSKLPERDLPSSHRSALERVCENKKIAHLGEFAVVVLSANELEQEKGCRFVFLERQLKLLYLTIAVTKDSPYRDVFDYQIDQMAITGILDRFRDANFPLWRAMTDATFQPVSIEQTVQMNLLFIVGSIAAILVFLGELLANRH